MCFDEFEHYCSDMNTVVFHPSVEHTIANAVEHYEAQRLELGLDYLEVVEHAAQFLERYPETGTIVRGSIRCLGLPRFPYSLLYRIAGDGEIRILAIVSRSGSSVGEVEVGR